ncbi:MAG TPA: MerR family transcriptional regulator [Nannocystis exedens]|nr:MerR family transcriptional regulator [Nannocystis exedens]
MAKRRERPEGAADRIVSDKLYFKIGEVAEIAGVERHVLRFWEENFEGLRPTRSRSRQRVYRRRDVELVLKIKGLLYGEKMTIAGARRRLLEDRDGVPQAAPDVAYQARASARLLQREIDALRALLDRPANPAVDADPLALIRRRGGTPGMPARACAEADPSILGSSGGLRRSKRA